MKQTATRPTPASILERVGRIMMLGIEITNLRRYHVFVNWSGHVNVISVHAHCAATADYSGTKTNERLADIEARLDWDHAEIQLDNIITVMESLR